MLNPYKEIIENNFTNHAPKDEQTIVLYETFRAKAKELAYFIIDNMPDCRERALAMTNLENAVMWAIASVARN